MAKKLNILVIIYLDNILKYIKEKDQDYIIIFYQVLDILQKYGFFKNFKK